MSFDSLIKFGYNLLYRMKFYEARLIWYQFFNTVSPLKSEEIRRKIDSAVHEKRCSTVAEKYLERLEKDGHFEHFKSPPAGEKIIWQCWFQGEENAPDVIKKCFETVKKFCGDYKRIVLSEKNIHEYVEFPDFILKKYEKGIICKAHFSDLLRVYLLSEYGGVWLDASVYLIRPIPEDILDADFFVFKRPKTKPNSRIIGNWFIVSKPHSILIEMIKESLTLFWKDEHDDIDYFIMHYLFSVAVRKNSLFQNEFEEIPFYSNRKPHRFDRLLHSKTGYSDSRLRKYHNALFCQKLFHRHPLAGELLNRINKLNLN